MKKISILLLSLALLLSGCQLARTDLESTGDRLVGMFITTEHLDLFDDEAWLRDNLNRLGPGVELTVEDTSEYQQRLYAQLVPEQLTNDRGEKVEHWTFEFPGVTGIDYFVARVEKDAESYWDSTSDDAIIGGNTHFAYTDKGTDIELEGEIWLAHDQGILECYFNPVYQDRDGNVYLTAGNGYSTMGDSAPGTQYSQTWTETTTTDSNGETEESTTTVSISVGTMVVPEKYVLVQMDTRSNVLSSDVFAPGQMPETVSILDNTAYVVLENHGREDVTRELYDSDTDMVKTFYCREDGFMGQAYTTLEWTK